VEASSRGSLFALCDPFLGGFMVESTTQNHENIPKNIFSISIGKVSVKPTNISFIDFR
jgi:hypothetical protein